MMPFADWGFTGAIASDSRRTGGTDSTSFNNAGLPGIGLAQDALSPPNPLGMFGIVKTLVGYFAASASLRFDVENPMIRLVLGFFFFFFHQFFYWVLAHALLSETVDFDLQRTLVVAVLNAMVAVPLYHILDKLRVAA